MWFLLTSLKGFYTNILTKKRKYKPIEGLSNAIKIEYRGKHVTLTNWFCLLLTSWLSASSINRESFPAQNQIFKNAEKVIDFGS